MTEEKWFAFVGKPGLETITVTKDGVVTIWIGRKVEDVEIKEVVVKRG